MEAATAAPPPAAAASVPTEPAAEPTFLDELRGASMRLHSMDQAKEGEQTSQKPVAQWAPSEAAFVQHLVDSLQVHNALETYILFRPRLGPLLETGLERSAPLRTDLAGLRTRGGDWPAELPAPSDGAVEYAELIGRADIPAFVAHYYSFVFAHTAGGRFIGKRMEGLLLSNEPLQFYHTYPQEGGPGACIAAAKAELDAVVSGWSDAQKAACLDSVPAAFRGGGLVLSHLRQ